jgi:hypothetical protein
MQSKKNAGNMWKCDYIQDGVPVKDNLGLKTPRVYSIPSLSAAKCILDRLVGQSRPGRRSTTRTSGQPDKLVVAEHRFNSDHHTHLQDTKILST